MISPIVDSKWLEAHREQVVIADCRWYLDGRSGFAAYESAHIPGAIFVDLDKHLADHGDPKRGRHPLPSPAQFAESMSANGIGDGATVIAYDDEGGVVAARIVWMLRVLGENAAILDGGIQKYLGQLESGTRTPARASFTKRNWPEDRIANLEDACDSNNIVIDARNRNRYTGEFEPVDARAGHIPGAINIPCRQNLQQDGTFMSKENLRKVFENAGIHEDSQVISYCGSGVTACHNLLAMEWIGLNKGRLFPGSWSQYSQALDLKVSLGSEPK